MVMVPASLLSISVDITIIIIINQNLLLALLHSTLQTLKHMNWKRNQIHIYFLIYKFHQLISQQHLLLLFASFWTIV